MAEAKKKASNSSTKNKSTNTKSDTKNNTKKGTQIKKDNGSKKAVTKPIIKEEKKTEKVVAKNKTSKKENQIVKPEKNITNIDSKKEEVKSTKKGNKALKIVLYLIILVLVGVLGYSTYKIVSWQIDNNKTQDLIKEFEGDVKIKESDGENAEIIIPDEFSEENLNFLAKKLIDVDLSGIKKENKDIVGWIQVAGTKVNYPFVQTKDNSYYLNHSIDKSINEAGWIFADYRNKLGNDKNTILYGHGRLNKTMFGSLNDILESDWTKDHDNFIIRMSTDNENSLWQIFSVYHINTTNDYTHINFANDDDFVKFANKMIKRSMYDFKTSVNADDVMITLSTCYSNEEKMVIHAKLIKKEAKTTDHKTDKEAKEKTN